MPRSTAKSRAKNKNNVKSCDVTKNSSKKQKNDKKEKCIKKELAVDMPKGTVVEEVFHRKSERRRVARDIFLVFEEESSRRKTRSNKQTKPKFGHLKVEDPLRPKGLLRDIKNEPKCYLSNSAVSVDTALTTDVPIKKRNTNILNVKKEEKCGKSERNKSISKCLNPCYPSKSKNTKSLKISTVEPQTCTLDKETKIVARVNPIFLWVKQDNTRIVEVRCEDYDKRNRIRITKTSNGWRAIPRSDPSTSRVLKFYPTPLMKVKREKTIHEPDNIISRKIENRDTVVCKNFSIPNVLPECIANEIETKLNGIDTVCNPLAIKNRKAKRKKAKKVKKKSNSEKSITKSNITAESNNVININIGAVTMQLNPPTNASSLEIPDIPIQPSTGPDSVINKQDAFEKRLCSKDFDKKFSVYAFNKNTEDFEDKSISVNSPLSTVIPSEIKSVYQNDPEEELSLHLCPKTGLFLPNNISIPEYENESNDMPEKIISITAKNCFHDASKEEFISDLAKIDLQSKIQVSEENTESLEAKTKNLKDLLDDADLLQNCDDNANSDADLIDTIVKSSCENNLIQANEIISKANIDELHPKALHVSNDIVVQLIADVSNPPKCLSFNEAGEIEGLNGELFQSNTYLETFDKQSSAMQAENPGVLHSTTSVVETTSMSQKPSLCANMEPILVDNVVDISKLGPISEIEESPKDLSYKKREEVCPPSESRSQCAVTSSSDVIKSPHQEDTSLASSSETLKNLILEQFIKLNALSTQHHREPSDIEKQRHSDNSNIKSMYTSKSAQCNNYIETVVIEDEENGGDIDHDEPLKKRIRINKHKVTQNMSKLAMIDKDPDPLTQLRLLIRNTQWKVPDPILVPKDRLSAVLASPAREIPLLITTRPELRLPEAFAYPEIIQNPNILVISMAQLEAILKNELEMEKTSSLNSMKPEITNQLSDDQMETQLTNRINDLESSSPRHHLKHTSKQSKNLLTSINDSQHAGNSIISDTQRDSAPTELNSATMAVLNQMLWLPYFGQISQDIEKTLKNPLASQEKCSNIVPFFNAQLNNITNLEEIFKTTTNNKTSGKLASNPGFQNFQQQFKTNEELSLFQKIVQHQMQSVLQLNQLKADSSQHGSSAAVENTASSIDNSKSKTDANNLIEQKKPKVFSNKQTYNTLCKNQTNSCNNNILAPEKSYNLRSSVAGRHSVESKQYSNNNQRQVTENKPRLTCKSLSNLLDPEHSMLPSSSCANPLVQNLSSDYLKNVNEVKRNSTECNVNDNSVEGTRQFLCNASIVPPTLGSYSNINVNFEPSSEHIKQKPKILENNHGNNDAPGLTADTNAPLWHPLFGSNTKTAYSSPWQWTTVTATGE